MDKSVFSKDYEVFIEHLRRAREDASVTQVELAERLSATQSFVSKCERGERRLDVIELRTWCGALGASFPAFFARLHRSLPGKKRN